MKRIFIHIGTHKTGTTSIQAFLMKNAQALRSSGILVPRTGEISVTGGQHNVAWELMGHPRHNPDIGGVDALLQELSQSDLPKAVLSSEDFEYLTMVPERIRFFDERLCALGYDTHYLVYFRSFDSYADSLYAELHDKHGMTDTKADFMARLAKDRSITFNGNLYFEFDYDRLVRSWTQMVGPKLSHFSYEQVAASEGVVPHFLRVVGASEDVIAQGRSARVLNKTKRKWLRFWR